MTLEEKKIQRLYEILDNTEDAEQIAALKWAIAELEMQFNTHPGTAFANPVIGQTAPKGTTIRKLPNGRIELVPPTDQE